MGVAEEEVLIRDDSGLLLDTSEVRIPKSQVWRRKLTRTICLALGFLVLGLCVAIPGPTLLDLEDQVKASTSQMMIVLASRSLGYLLGALLGGMLFDCFDKQLLLFCTLLVSSVATVVIPWSLTLVIMGTMFALQGITMGVLDTGGNVYCIQLWGRKNGPFIQTLHFAFGIGAFVAPLLARPFLSSANFTYNSTIVQGNIPVAPFLHEHHTLNMTRRSVVDIFTELNKFQQDHFNSDLPTYGVSHNLLWNKTFHHGDSDYSAIQLTHPSQLNVVPGIYLAKRHSVDRISKREIIDEISKREVIDKISKREVIDPSNSNNSESVSQESADIPVVTNSPSVSPSINSIVSEGENGAETLDEKGTENVNENGAKAIDENGMKPGDENGATVDESKNEVKTVINSTENVITSITVQPNITTVGVTPLTTSEKEVVKKPTAVTDNNRKSSSADGKPIIQHLDDHNIKAGPDSKAEQGPDVVPSNSPPVPTTGLNGTELNETVGDINSTDTSNLETASNNITEKNSTQNVTEPVKNSESESPAKGPEITGTTLKTPDVSENVLNETKEMHIPVNTNSATKATTTTLAPAPTTKKKIEEKTTTTAKATTTTTTTTKAPTTTTTSTTTKTTTTTTTLKPLSTTTPKKTTETPIPTTARPTVIVKPTSHVDTDTVTEQTTKPVPVVKTTVNSTSVNNTGNEPTTTEISKKPETTVDSFINHAITAVKNISRIQFAYIIIGLALFVIAIVFLVLYCQDKRRLSACDDFAELLPFKSVDNCTKYSLVILLGLFFFSYMGLEVTFGALVSIFATEHNHWPKEQGAVVAAIFWGSLATGRGLSIFMARCCGPTVMLTIDLFFMLIGGLVLAIGIPYYDKLLWLGTLILGLGMSSAFPAGISWAETRFHLSGKTTAIFVTGSAIGQMVIPILSGYLYESFGAMCLMYVTVALTITTIIMFILMQCVSVKKGNNLQVNARNGGFLPLEDVDDDDALEMGDLVHFDKSQTRKIKDTRQGARGNAEYHTLISDLDDD